MDFLIKLTLVTASISTQHHNIIIYFVRLLIPQWNCTSPLLTTGLYCIVKHWLTTSDVTCYMHIASINGIKGKVQISCISTTVNLCPSSLVKLSNCG